MSQKAKPRGGAGARRQAAASAKAAVAAPVESAAISHDAPGAATAAVFAESSAPPVEAAEAAEAAGEVDAIGAASAAPAAAGLADAADTASVETAAADRAEPAGEDACRGALGLTSEQLMGAVEALLFAASAPMGLSDLAEVLARALQLPAVSETMRDEVDTALALLVARWGAPGQGLALVRVARGWAFRTQAAHAEVVRALHAPRAQRLSRAAMETLAIVAYRQPVTKPEVDHIRGVDCGGTFKLLLDRDLVRIVGKKDDVGRPMLYGTTNAFLSLFTLGDLGDLPSLREVQDLSDEAARELAAQGQLSVSELVAQAPPLAAPDDGPVDRLAAAVAGLEATQSQAQAAMAAQGLDLSAGS